MNIYYITYIAISYGYISHNHGHYGYLSRTKTIISHEYCKTSNIRHTLGNKIVDHSDVVGASPVGADPTASSFST